MRLSWTRGGWVAVLIAACAVLSACGLNDHSSLTVQASGSVSEAAIVVSEPPAESILPSSKLLASGSEVSLLTYLGSTAPIYTYNSENDILLVYCYGANSAHLPYDLSTGLPVDGSEHPVYIPDLGIDAFIRFDSEYDIWRVLVSEPGSPRTECIVYFDDPAITDISENLRREVLPGAAPRYYLMENGLYYSYDGKAKEITVDLSGDGAEERVVFNKSADHGNGTSDYVIRIDGETAAEIVQADSMEGAFETDVLKEDAFLEIAFEYKDKSGNPTTLLLRYDGNSIRTAVFEAWIDCAGDGTVLLRNEEGGISSEKYMADEWFRFVKMTTYSGSGESDTGG